ncbi:hypothetical protein ACOME3_000023 [Neoechinorhynchus agilis]
MSFRFLLLICTLSMISYQSAEEVLSADELYSRGINLVTGIYRKYKSGYQLLTRAATMGHQGAVVQLGVAHLFGDYYPFNFSYARELLESVAHNRTDAQFYLGFVHSLGLGVESSQAKALTYYTFAALGDNTMAQMSLAYRLLYQINTPLDCEQSLALYSKVAGKVASQITLSSGPLIQRITLNNDATGPDQSSFVLGTNRGSVIIDQDTLAYYELMAERGETHAQVGLGSLYYTGGRGIKPNFKKALYHLSKAAQKGSHSSQAIIGKIYAQGDETLAPDPKLAIQHLRRAGDKNEPVAFAALGTMYYHGIGVEKDEKLAYGYLKMAADANQVDAMVWLGAMHFYGHYVKKDTRVAIQYFTHATQAGHVLGPYYLALVHEIGVGVIRNCETSARLFKTVAERGRWSMAFMDAYYDFQHKRFNQAVMKYLLLSELGYEIAQNNAAVLLEHGKTNLFGVRANLSVKASKDALAMAFAQHSRAAEQGHSASRVRVLRRIIAYRERSLFIPSIRNPLGLR